MVVLDTDHLSILERKDSAEAQAILRRLDTLKAGELFASVISFEEQVRGWMAALAKAKNILKQIEAYRRLIQMLDTYRVIPVLEFSEQAAIHFQAFRKKYPRLAQMDLKIAGIVAAHDALLITRNTKDFGQITEIRIEDWTTEVQTP